MKAKQVLSSHIKYNLHKAIRNGILWAQRVIVKLKCTHNECVECIWNI